MYSQLDESIIKATDNEGASFIFQRHDKVHQRKAETFIASTMHKEATALFVFGPHSRRQTERRQVFRMITPQPISSDMDLVLRNSDKNIFKHRKGFNISTQSLKGHEEFT